MRSYIQLEAFRHSPSDLIEFAVQGTTKGIMIEPLLFMPLIENTFKHVLRRDIVDKWVKIILYAEEKELIFQTSNPLVVSEAKGDYGGVGLKNVIQRLDILYPGKYELKIFEEDHTFTVTLTLYLS